MRHDYASFPDSRPKQGLGRQSQRNPCEAQKPKAGAEPKATITAALTLLEAAGSQLRELHSKTPVGTIVPAGVFVFRLLREYASFCAEKGNSPGLRLSFDGRRHA